MPSPYRQSDNTPPTPLAELEWRGRVARSARWAARLLLGEALLLLATYWLPAHIALVGVVAWSVLGAGAAVATWRLTERRPGGRVGLWGWLSRGSVPAYLAVTGLLLFGMHLEIASYVAGGLLVVTAFGQPVRFRRSQKRRRSPWRWVESVLMQLVIQFLMPALIALVTPLLPAFATWRTCGLLFLPLGALSFGSLRLVLLPVDHQFWFDGGMEPPGEWVSLLVYRDEQAEVWCFDEMIGSFWTRDEALEWLGENGYVPAERALAEHLVAAVPPDNLPRLRPRKVRARSEKPRVRESAPRVRVAVEAPDADPVDEPALDEAEPRRAAAVQKP